MKCEFYLNVLDSIASFGDINAIDSFATAWVVLIYWVTYAVNYIGIFGCVSYESVQENTPAYLGTFFFALVLFSLWEDLLEAIRGRGKD